MMLSETLGAHVGGFPHHLLEDFELLLDLVDLADLLDLDALLFHSGCQFQGAVADVVVVEPGFQPAVHGGLPVQAKSSGHL